MTKAVYRDYNAEELNKEYDVEAATPELGSIMADYQARSDVVRADAAVRLDVAYGPDPLQQMDVFAPARTTDAPIQVYIHGGYWRGGSKNGRAFPAEVFNRAGAVWIPIDYRIAPAVTLDAIVHDVRLAVAWIYNNAASFGGDRNRIYVSGTSAGGHLTAMLLLDDWQGGFGLPGDVVRGGCAISGLFDLAPLRFTGENATLKLDEWSIERNSPIRHIPQTDRPLIAAWGGRESDEFARQSREFASAWRGLNGDAVEVELAGHDHFSAIGDLAEPKEPLLRAIFDQMGLAWSA